MSLTVLAYSLLTGLGLLVFFWALSGRSTLSVGRIRADLAMTSPTVAPTVSEVDLRRPFADRFLRPPMERLSAWLARQTPRHLLEQVETRLAMAGSPVGLSASEYLAISFVVGLLLIAAGVIAGSIAGSVLAVAIGAAAGAVLGYLLPTAWLSGIIRRRQRKIIGALPDAIDLLTIGVEAGLALDFAMSRLVERMHNPLAQEMDLALKQIRLGRPRAEALEEMAARTGLEELHSLVQSIIQSERMGVGIAKILRAQAADIRVRRRRKVQMAAAQAPLKMLFPMVGCIFPSIWIMLLGPGLLLLVKTL